MRAHELDIPVNKQVAKFSMYTGVVKLLSEQFHGCVHEPPLRGLIEEAWRNAAKKLGARMGVSRFSCGRGI